METASKRYRWRTGSSPNTLATALTTTLSTTSPPSSKVRRPCLPPVRQREARIKRRLANLIAALSLALFLLLVFSLGARADCLNPAGKNGVIDYNYAFGMPQYCNGTNWVAMAAPTANLTQNLVGWWKFDDGSGTSAADSTGNGWTGTLTNAPTWGTGINGGALTFNGTNQCVQTAGTFNIPAGNSFTIAAWVNPDPSSTTSTDAALYQSTGGAASQWVVAAAAGFVDFYTGNGYGGWLSAQGSWSGSNALVAGQWSHIAIVGTSTTTTIYINGVVAGSAPLASFSGAFPTSALAIGCSGGSGNWKKAASTTSASTAAP